jgi:hypothetical protein
VLRFLKKTKTSSEILKIIFEQLTEFTSSLPENSEAWKDEEVSFAIYSKERDCLFLFVVFCAIQNSKLPDSEKRYLLDLFREVLGGDVQAGKVDAQIEINLQDYCDAANAPHPKHLNPLWNVGLAFARHIGANKDIAYVQSAGTMYAGMLTPTVEFLNAIAKSYKIVKG